MPEISRDLWERIINLRRTRAIIADGRDIPIAIFLQPALGMSAKPLNPLREKPYVDRKPAWQYARRTFFVAAREMLVALRAKYAKGGEVCIQDVSDVFNDEPRLVYEDSGHLIGLGNGIAAKRLFAEQASCDMLEGIAK